MNKLPLYQQVALRRDIEKHGLKVGDVATLVDYVPHSAGDREGCVLEVFNALGESIAVVVVETFDIEPLTADEILTVRPLARAS